MPTARSRLGRARLTLATLLLGVSLARCGDGQAGPARCGAGTTENQGECVAIEHAAHDDSDAGPRSICGPGTIEIEGRCTALEAGADADAGPGLRCGEGTHRHAGQCVPDPPACEAQACSPPDPPDPPIPISWSNPVAEENAQPGSADWQLENPATAREIEGYASLTSVNRGASIALYVSTPAAGYAIDVFRMGYYAGLGARRALETVSRAGTLQQTPSPGADGLIECDWSDPYLLDVPGDWVSGVYLAKLTESAAGKQSYIVFVVRDDARAADYLVQSSVTTFQAYNNWGGKSLYDFNSQGEQRAAKVSFNRPYGIGLNVAGAARGVGAGEFLTTLQARAETRPTAWEYSMVRFLEREQYDVTYSTNVDLHENPDLLANHKALLSLGHDEYWSWRMRNQAESARDRFGTQLGFFSGNVCYWQIRFEPDALGHPFRTQVAYKDETTDPVFGTSDGYLLTTRWALLPLSAPETSLVGVRHQAAGIAADLVVDDETSWPLAGTGLRSGDRIAGLLGYEVDGAPSSLPAGMSRVMHSPWATATASNFADMVAFVVPSGAWTFAAGSIQFGWGVDDFGSDDLEQPLVSPPLQRLTRNVLDRLRKTPSPSTSLVLVQDDFSRPERDPDTWSPGFISEPKAGFDPLVTVVQDGRLRIAPRANVVGLHHNGYVTQRTWDMTDGAASVQLLQAPDTTGSADASFALSADATHWVRFSLESTALLFQSNAGGTITRQSVTYDPVRHRFLRLRYLRVAGEFAWETSADGVAFEIAQRSPSAIEVTAMRAELEAGTYQPEPAPGLAIFDDFRIESTGMRDDFTGARRAEYWTPGSASQGPAIYDPESAAIQFAGQLTLRPRAGASGVHGAGYLSTRRWDLRDGTALVEVAAIAADLAMTGFALVADATHFARFAARNGELVFEQRVDGIETSTSLPYDAVAHRFWRFSHVAAGQTLHWETSPDAITWTVRRSAPAGVNMSALTVELMASTDRPVATPGAAVFESFLLQRGGFAE